MNTAAVIIKNELILTKILLVCILIEFIDLTHVANIAIVIEISIKTVLADFADVAEKGRSSRRLARRSLGKGGFLRYR